jgi:hypothetical protein
VHDRDRHDAPWPCLRALRKSDSPASHLRDMLKARARPGLAGKSKTRESDASDDAELDLPYHDLKRTAVRHALSSLPLRNPIQGISVRR